MTDRQSEIESLYAKSGRYRVSRNICTIIAGAGAAATVISGEITTSALPEVFDPSKSLPERILALVPALGTLVVGVSTSVAFVGALEQSAEARQYEAEARQLERNADTPAPSVLP